MCLSVKSIRWRLYRCNWSTCVYSPEVERVIRLIGLRVTFVSSSSVDVRWDKCGGGCQKSQNSLEDAVLDEKKRRANWGTGKWRESRVMRGRRTTKSQKKEIEETINKGKEVNFAVLTDRPVGEMRGRETEGGRGG